MANVVVMPWSARALTREGSTPREAKVRGAPGSAGGRSEGSKTRSDGSMVVVMGLGNSLSSLSDGRRPPLDPVPFTGACGPASGRRPVCVGRSEQDEEDPGGGARARPQVPVY